jgi:hypothetical protein
VHPTLGILARFQAFFYASAFFQSDGVPPPDPAQVTQTVSPQNRVITFEIFIFVLALFPSVDKGLK